MRELAPHIGELVDAMNAELVTGGNGGAAIREAVPGAVTAATTASMAIQPDRRTALLSGAKPASSEEEVFVGGIALVVQQMLATVRELIAARAAELAAGTRPSPATDTVEAGLQHASFAPPLTLDRPRASTSGSS